MSATAVRIAVITPAAPIVTPADARSRLGIEGADEALEGVIAAAQAMIDGPGGWLGLAVGV